MTQDWDIKPRSGQCSLCDAAFHDGDPCFSELLFDEAGYHRRDICGTCRQAGEAGDARVYSMWRGRFRAPPPPPEDPLKKETAESLLRRRLAEKVPGSEAALYVLALMLERKRILVEREVRPGQDGSRIRVYEHRKTGELFLVPDPGLRLDQLEPVQARVVALLAETEPAAPSPDAAHDPCPTTPPS